VGSRVAGWHIYKQKNPNLGKFWKDLLWNMLVYFMVIGSNLRPFGIFCGHLVYFSRFGMLYKEKSSNPGGIRTLDRRLRTQLWRPHSFQIPAVIFQELVSRDFRRLWRRYLSVLINQPTF
jgi:hypothetical protein